MIGPIIEILFGLAVWKLLPSFITTAKKKKTRKQIALWCNIIGVLIIFAGALHLLSGLFSFGE